MKNTKNNSKNNDGKRLFTENPLLLGVIVFALAILINYLLETEFAKNFFNWAGYYFNYSIYWLNSTLQPMFKDHPFIKIPVMANPVTPQIMAVINPWMWLRGFMVSSVLVGQCITILNIKRIQTANIFNASILAGIFQFIMYVLPYKAGLSPAFLLLLMQKNYVNILVLVFVCLVGILSGVEYAVYLFRNEKIKVDSRTDGPNVAVKVVNKWE